MDGNITRIALIILLFTLSLFPGNSIASIEAIKPDPKGKQPKFKAYTVKKDITTPITTVPTMIPAMTTPIMNPTSESGLGGGLGGGGSSWCVASLSASQMALQIALDYACGIGGADCGAIQLGGRCFFPNSVREHASYAFNSYYQKNPLPNSCNFAGSAVVTSTNPSSGTCLYPSTSTSSSILNTTNSSGSTVFGAVPSAPSASPSANSHLQSLFTFTSLLFLHSLL